MRDVSNLKCSKLHLGFECSLRHCGPSCSASVSAWSTRQGCVASRWHLKILFPLVIRDLQFVCFELKYVFSTITPVPMREQAGGCTVLIYPVFVRLALFTLLAGMNPLQTIVCGLKGLEPARLFHCLFCAQLANAD